MASIEWTEDTDEFDNTVWTGDSAYTVDESPLKWRLVQRFNENTLKWIATHDAELMTGDFTWLEWPTIEDAKSSCQKAHDNILDDIFANDTPKESK